MNYYIIGPNDQFKFLQENFENLKEALHLNFPLPDKLPWTAEEECVFLVDLDNLESKYHSSILRLKTSANHKLLYFTSDLKSQSKHQNSEIGGDAYIVWTVENDVLEDMINNLFIDISPRNHPLDTSQVVQIQDKSLDAFAANPISVELNQIFNQHKIRPKKPHFQSESTLASTELPEDLVLGEEMSDKDQELSLDDLDGLELSDDSAIEHQPQEDTGLDLDLSSEEDFTLSDESDEISEDSEEEGYDFGDDSDLSLDTDFELNETDSANEAIENLGELDLDLNDSPELSTSPELSASANTDSEDLTLSGMEGLDDLSLGDEADLSEDAKEKLKEIDAIMDHDASQIDISLSSDKLTAADDNDDELLSFESSEEINLAEELKSDNSLDLPDDSLSDLGTGFSADELSMSDLDSNLETSLVSDDVDLTSIDFPEIEEEEVVAKPASPDKKKKTEASKSSTVSNKDINEIAGAYTGEMERLQATISNLRQDREELLDKIQKLEEEKILQNRETLTLRAELDEKKIELSIIRRKLNDEIYELKDLVKIQEEKKLILEEKNKIYTAEIEKLSQKNKLDVKKIQIRERELEQRLELLKADTETQIRHRDLKILELKRKIDSMEFDMESINDKEQKSVESRFELEDKLDKAIKTLRNAISLLEDDPDNKASVVSTLKKNIDM